MPTETNNHPSLELFRFVNVRNPEPKVIIPTNSPTSGVKRFKQVAPIFLDEAYLATGTFHNSLKTLAAATYDHEDYAAAESAFIAGDFIKSREDLTALAFSPNVLKKMGESTFANEAALTTFINTATGIDITDTGATDVISPLYEQIWNNLLFYAIAQYKNESLHNDLIEVAKVIEMMKELILNPTQGFNIDSFVQNITKSYFVIPADIIPSTFPALEAETEPEDPEYQRTHERIDINTDTKQLEATAKMLDNWFEHTIALYHLELQNAAPTNDLPDYALYKKLTDPETPTDDTEVDTWNGSNYNTGLTNSGLNQSLFGDLKTALNISTDADKLAEIKSFAEVSTEADDLADRLATFMKADTLYHYDYLKKKINDSITKNGKKLAALAPSGFKKQGLIGGSIFEKQDKDYNGDPVSLIGGTESFNPCTIKILGTGDLFKVKQKLICYKPSEIAHIENIMSGEERKRSTRRAKIIETETITEIEKETSEEKDLKTTERYEMESQAAKTVAENTSITAGVNATGKLGLVTLSVDAGFSYGRSSSESSTSASRFSKEMTETTRKKVSERIKTTTRIKIIEEFEEKNEHNFVNASADHKVGVYRFIDKVYEAKLMNYGRRTFLQFMVPEPAAFYIQNMMDAKKPGAEIFKPIAPEELNYWDHHSITPLKNFEDISELNYQLWASIYDATNITPPPQSQYTKSASEVLTLQQGANVKSGEIKTIIADDGYFITRVTINGYVDDGKNWLYINSGSSDFSYSIQNRRFYFDYLLSPVDRTISYPLSYTFINVRPDQDLRGHMNVVYHLQRTTEKYKQWQIATYNVIMEAYARKKSDYDQAVAVAQYNEPNYGNNPGILKEIQEREIKRCCMEELLSIREKVVPPDLLYRNRWGDFGAVRNQTINGCEGTSGYDYPKINDLCDVNTKGRDVLFFEQAIDWENQTYVFYPYFWGRICKWKTLSTIENSDPLFTKFLQSGFARVVVPLRVGMEAAVFNYLKTGMVWNNQDIPSIGNQLYLDIIQEIKEATDYPEHPICVDSWTYQIPTNLVILQSDDSPIADEGLPCFAPEGCPS